MVNLKLNMVSVNKTIPALKLYLHPFHIVSPSPWPFLVAMSFFPLTIGAVMYMHSYLFGLLILLLGASNLIVLAYVWWRDVVREAVYESAHTTRVQNGLRLGFILFLISEAMFFFAFFWAFFYFSLSPSIHIGCLWPPYAITPINPFKTPLLNTFILLTSAVTITYTHRRMRLGYSLATFVGFVETLLLAFFFVSKQFFEYLHAPFAISDGVYGTTFYMITGLHGSHVIAGGLFILVNLIRFTQGQFARNHHLGFLFGLWYWHFVDVIWIFVYIFVYVWGSWRVI
jgi:heme/copper-type cytochrome/quinol oxidase subunit 3